VFEYGKDGPRVVLVGVDGSPTSLRAAAYGAGLARRQCARLVAVYVTPAVSGMAGMSAGSALGIAQAHDDVEAEMRALAEQRAADLGVQYEFCRRHGDPYREIVAVADEVHADAIVVGASTAVGHRLVGSLAVHLVRAGRWPVTVVP
jgi:nucleotide-binding universal stress UspA family protein